MKIIGMTFFMKETGVRYGINELTTFQYIERRQDVSL